MGARYVCIAPMPTARGRLTLAGTTTNYCSLIYPGQSELPQALVRQRQDTDGAPRRLLDGSFLCRGKLRLKLVGDGFGDVALDREDIVQRPVVSLRPNMFVARRVNQLRSDPDPITGGLHAPFYDVGYT